MVQSGAKKATGFKYLLKNSWEIKHIASKCQTDFFFFFLKKHVEKRSKTEKRKLPLNFTYLK